MNQTRPLDVRTFWLEEMLRCATPVLGKLSEGRLRVEMPLEQRLSENKPIRDRRAYSCLEAFGRTLAGIAPWLEWEGGDPLEQENRQRCRKQVHDSLRQITDRSSPDAVDFSAGPQILVDSAFLAQGLLRSWKQCWLPLDQETKSKVIQSLIQTRQFKPGPTNWLLFSAMVEAFLCRAGGPWEREPIHHAVEEHMKWYKGDGVYGDGVEVHNDYYNSFVIHPMLVDIVGVGGDISEMFLSCRDKILHRASRYAVVQERMIAPDGTFPPLGRSLTYRFGAFHALGQMVLLDKLPAEVSLSGVREGLTAVLQNLMGAPGVYDEKGWLTIGLYGHQPSLGESYISTGSLYVHLCGFLPLGLPATHPFWSHPAEDWTSKKIWSGEQMPLDSDYKE